MFADLRSYSRHQTAERPGAMGYAGYAPGKYAPPKPTEVQAALRQVAKQDSYEMLSKLLRNVVRAPVHFVAGCKTALLTESVHLSASASA